MEKLTKKEIKERYMNRILVGGVYCIKCSGSSRVWIKSTIDLEGQSNKYKFSISTKSCPEPTMRSDWEQYGAESFSFSVIEKLEKRETQTDQEFAEDIRTLYEMWLENMPI